MGNSILQLKNMHILYAKQLDKSHCISDENLKTQLKT